MRVVGRFPSQIQKMDSREGSAEATVGQLLKEARSARGLTIEAAAAASKIPLHLARLMEEQQFHLLPDPFYVIRFLRDYSVALGLDPKQVETRFRRQVHPPRSSAPLQPPSSIGSRIPVRRLLLYLLPAAAAVPLIFIVLSLFSGRSPAPPASQEPQPPQPQEVSPQPSQVGPAPPPPGPQEASPGALAPQSQPSRYTLRAEAKETTWLAVSVDGSARREVLLRAGGAAQWSASKGFVVTIGNAEGIALSLNGKLVTLTGGPNRVVQDLTLPGDAGPVKRR